MIIRVRASNKRTSPNPDDIRERGGFLLLPKAIKHNDTYIVRWLERSTWLESCNYRYPNLARDMIRDKGYTSMSPRWRATKWLDIEEAAVDGLNKLNTVAENPVEQYPYK